MKSKVLVLSIGLFLSFSSCNKNHEAEGEPSATTKTNELITESEPIRSRTFIDNASKKSQRLIAGNKHTPFLDLQQQKLNKIEENSEVIVSTNKLDKLTGNQAYYYLKERTMLIGSSYLCELCPNVHLKNASGYAISEDGVIVTNYHVIEIDEDLDVSGIFVTDSRGGVYPVVEILAASQSNDLAILKVDTNGEKLKHIPFAETELMGEDIYLMGHPYDNLFFMSKGIVSRKYVSDRDYEVKIGVTAEFGQGASGGPIVNEHGQLIGMVAGVQPHMASQNGSHGPTLMVSREAVPVSVINKYVKRN